MCLVPLVPPRGKRKTRRRNLHRRYFPSTSNPHVLLSALAWRSVSPDVCLECSLPSDPRGTFLCILGDPGQRVLLHGCQVLWNPTAVLWPSVTGLCRDERSDLPQLPCCHASRCCSICAPPPADRFQDKAYVFMRAEWSLNPNSADAARPVAFNLPSLTCLQPPR